MTRIRPIEPGDLPAVAALRRSIFRHSEQPSAESLAAYYRLILFENPWRDENLPSVGYVGEQGDIQGFLGVIPRPMLLGGMRVTAVTTTELMIAPEVRGLGAVQLLRHVFAGRQDVSFADRATDQVRAMCEALGGGPALWNSLYWTMRLDGAPLRFDAGSQRTSPTVVARALRYAARSIDALAAKLQRPSSPGNAPLHDEPLDVATVCDLLPRIAGPKTLMPEYDRHSYEWLLQRLRERPIFERIVTRQVRSEGSLVGWYVYAIRDRRVADVVDIAALPGTESGVFDCLAESAMNDNVLWLSGRLNRRFSRVIVERQLPLTLAQPWAVVNTRRADIASAFAMGNVLFSRLLAEWWIGT